MATVPSGSSFYNVAPIPGDNNTGSGATAGWYGYAVCASSNTTISNVNVKSSSVILITPIATDGGDDNAPSIITQTAGSFVVNWVNFPVPAAVYYYVLS
jgi:hypothetical protein